MESLTKKHTVEDIASSLNDDGTIKSDLTRARKKVDAITAKAKEEGTNILGTIDREAEAKTRQERDEQNRSRRCSKICYY